MVHISGPNSNPTGSQERPPAELCSPLGGLSETNVVREKMVRLSGPSSNPTGSQGRPPAELCSPLGGLSEANVVREKNGAPERIRTPGPQIRSLVLYPAELPVPYVKETEFLTAAPPPINSEHLFDKAISLIGSLEEIKRCSRIKTINLGQKFSIRHIGSTRGFSLQDPVYPYANQFAPMRIKEVPPVHDQWSFPARKSWLILVLPIPAG